MMVKNFTTKSLKCSAKNSHRPLERNKYALLLVVRGKDQNLKPYENVVKLKAFENANRISQQSYRVIVEKNGFIIKINIKGNLQLSVRK